jgi:uncharacterized protein
MKIWVDADSCPRPVRDIVARAAARRDIQAEFVANRSVPVLRRSTVTMTVVPEGEAGADRHILERARSEDLAVTRDIPLAEALVQRGLLVLNDRGTVFTEENVAARRSIRDVMQELREARGDSLGGRSYGAKKIKAFADAFDRALTGRLRDDSR